MQIRIFFLSAERKTLGKDWGVNSRIIFNRRD